MKKIAKMPDTMREKFIEMFIGYMNLPEQALKSLFVKRVVPVQIAEQCYNYSVKGGELQPIESLPEEKKKEIWQEAHRWYEEFGQEKEMKSLIRLTKVIWLVKNASKN